MADLHKNLLEEMYPEADKVFSFTYKSARDTKDTCLYVLDTNVLLVPFDINKENLDEISRIFLQLKGQQRLYIPAQVAREFAHNRAEKIRNVYDTINQLEKTFNAGNFVINSPFLASHPAFIGLQANLTYIRRLIDEARKDVKNISDYLQHWNGNDAVSSKYSAIFTSDIIIPLQMDPDKFQKYFEFKSKNKIAPGYKDAAKDDNGRGDVIIWRTLIELAKEKNNDITFVSNDQKTDWYYIKDKSNHKSLIPKYELLDEFRRETKGKSINLINFQDFLQLVDAKEEVIEEVSHIANQEDSLKGQAWVFSGEDLEKVKVEEQRLIDEINKLDGSDYIINQQLGDISQDRIMGYQNTLSDEEVREIVQKKDKLETELKFIHYKKNLLQQKLQSIYDNYPELQE